VSALTTGAFSPPPLPTDLERRDELLAGDLAVHEALRDDARGEDLVALAELGKGDTGREAHADNADALEHAVAAQLLEHERRLDDARLLDLVRDDAPDKVRVRFVERVDQRRQLLLAERASTADRRTREA